MKTIQQIGLAIELLSDWIPIDIKPAYIGVYQVTRSPWYCAKTSGCYAYWNGFEWSDWQFKADVAFVWRGNPRHDVYCAWRGIAAPY